ncbi:MAG: hypothetical protein IPH77_20890 [Ignavibacteria bacterium]|nr:hypothetical protein [Ignavibacteria bacterium]
MYPNGVKWADEYKKHIPKYKFIFPGAGKGMTDALSGMVDLGMVSALFQKETDKGAWYIAVAKDAVLPP